MQNNISRWLIVAAVPALAWVVGAIALPEPQSARDGSGGEDLGARSPAVSRVRPTPKVPVGAELGGTVRVLGADLPTAPLARGDRLGCRFFFEALGEQEDDWQLFIHIDSKAAPYRIHGDHYPADGRHRTNLWERGEFITDDWSTTIPSDAPAGRYDVWLGFYIGDDRLDWTGGPPSNHDGKDRVLMGSVEIR